MSLSSLLTLDTSRKTHLKSGGWGIGLGGGVGWRGGVGKNFREIVENFPGNIREISRKFRRGPYVPTPFTYIPYLRSIHNTYG